MNRATLGPTLWTTGGRSHRKIVAHTKRDCRSVNVWQLADGFDVVPTAMLADDDAELPYRYKWCSYCATGRVRGGRSDAYVALTTSDPGDLLP